MAARLNPKQDERARSAIQTSQLINRLQDFVFQKEGVEIDPVRMKAIEILLRKSLPDLSAVQMDATHDVSDKLSEVMKAVAERGGRIGR
ncbi:MAG: hypothetical protein GOVbin1573_57 [Prokaryotic dsDNA virus sp.]|nr:MAG: hypothetical protein GOVbin1573_57 [Prokaryotic dsDNA virus sp.]|tara:strand:- start:1904 stop:2170 length:267 start_codon:yes stop_codon:yes gene_type:complete